MCLRNLSPPQRFIYTLTSSGAIYSHSKGLQISMDFPVFSKRGFVYVKSCLPLSGEEGATVQVSR